MSLHPIPEFSLEWLVANLIRLHQGRAEAISMSALAREAGLGTRQLQRIIKHLIEDHGEPIGSATGQPTGYYLITDEPEVRAAVAQLEHRLGSLARRIARLRRIAPEEVFGQMRMEL